MFTIAAMATGLFVHPAKTAPKPADMPFTWELEIRVSRWEGA